MTKEQLKTANDLDAHIEDMKRHVEDVKALIASEDCEFYDLNIMHEDSRFAKFVIRKDVLPTKIALTIYLERLEKELYLARERFYNL